MKNDTSVPWPMAIGSVAARIVCPLYVTFSLFSSSVVLTNVCPFRSEMSLHFINEKNPEDIHTQKQFLDGE